MDLKPYTEAIKRKINLVDFVGAHVELKQKSGKFVACCPFHNEKTPSFYVHADYFHCFGCQKHGDVFTFSTDYLGKKFWETLQELAKRTGVELPQQKEETPEIKKKRAEEARYFKVLSDAWTYFRESLASSDKAKSYLNKRGYTETEINSLPFGYAPIHGSGHGSAKETNLSQFLQKKGHKIPDMVALGLSRPSQRGSGYYDFFRDRLMIRIDDEYGRPVAFGGRSFAKTTEQGPKYINSPAHALFKKGELLFNFYAAKPSIQKKKRVVLCEGYMDVLKLTKHGLLESVAVLGTAAGLAHLQLIEKYADTLIVVFDGDEAGLRACRRLAPFVAQCKHMRVYLLRLPDGHDPDSYIESEGAEKFEQKIKNAPHFLDVVIEAELEETSQRPPGEMIDFLRKSAFTWMQGIKDPMHRDWMFGKIAKQTGIEKRLLMQSAGSGQKNPRNQPRQRQEAQQKTRASQSSDNAIRDAREYISLQSKPVLRAIVGALLFAEKEELDPDKTKNWMESNLKLPQVVMESLCFLLQRSNLTNAASELSLELVSGWELQLLPQKEQFTGRSKELMREVALRIRQNKLKSTIAGLKQRLKQTSEPETQQQLALEIQKLERSRV